MINEKEEKRQQKLVEIQNWIDNLEWYQTNEGFNYSQEILQFKGFLNWWKNTDIKQIERIKGKYPIKYIGKTMKCKICGDPIKRCHRRKTNNWCHTWKHNHYPKYYNKGNEKVREIIQYVSCGIFIIVISQIILWIISGRT